MFFRFNLHRKADGLVHCDQDDTLRLDTKFYSLSSQRMRHDGERRPRPSDSRLWE